MQGRSDIVAFSGGEQPHLVAAAVHSLAEGAAKLQVAPGGVAGCPWVAHSPHWPWEGVGGRVRMGALVPREAAAVDPLAQLLVSVLGLCSQPQKSSLSQPAAGKILYAGRSAKAICGQAEGKRKLSVGAHTSIQSMVRPSDGAVSLTSLQLLSRCCSEESLDEDT